MADNSEKYFVKWCNFILKPRKLKIESISKDFNDGIKLVALLEELSGTKCPKHLVEPKNDIFKLTNLSIAMDMAKKMVKTLMVNGQNFIHGTDTDIKLILGFIFDLVLHYQVDDIDMDGKHGKEGLLMWCQKTTAGHAHVDVQNFASSWLDGMAFLALVHAYNKDCVDYDAEAAAFETEKDLPKPQRVEKAKVRMNKAFKLISEQMDVEEILDDDFAEMPSDKANITYLSLIFKAFSQAKMKNKYQQVIGRMISKAQKMQDLKDQLAEKTKEFNADLAQANENLAKADPETIEEIQKRIQELYQQDRESSNKLQLTHGQIENLIFNMK